MSFDDHDSAQIEELHRIFPGVLNIRRAQDQSHRRDLKCGDQSHHRDLKSHLFIGMLLCGVDVANNRLEKQVIDRMPFLPT